MRVRSMESSRSARSDRTWWETSGLTLATIGGWILVGARYDVAYFTKAIEVVLVGFIVVTIYRFDGGPAGILARLRALPGELTDLLRGSR